MINVGGFGHSGNTALVDYLSDQLDICPVGYHYTETALLRSKWGLREILLQENNVPLDFVSDCLKGIKKEEHDAHSPPVIHDFKRNARVFGYLGNEYENCVDGLIQSLSISDKSKEHKKKLVNTFLHDVGALAKKKYGRDDALPLLRNDPAASNINLLSMVNYDFSFFVYRDVRDMMIDWVIYYGHSIDTEGCEKFIKQYINKTRSFLKLIKKLEHQTLKRVSFVSFEKLVESEEYRSKVNAKLEIDITTQTGGAFRPEVSKNNIGIYKKLPKECLSTLSKYTENINSDLKATIEEFELEN
tara:strand:- start:11276 stop:12178 length:903 start_codon:yes stop_codon:yes gene_type:complete